MTARFLEITATPSVRAARQENGSFGLWEPRGVDDRPDRLPDRAVAFIARRDSFYLATTSQSGWPHVQHRGGPPGFLRVLDDRTLGFADFSGNRQYLSLGNLAADARAALILVDYPNRARLKLLVHMKAYDLQAGPELAARLVPAGYAAVPERGFVLDLEAYDWNCPQHITPRFTLAEIETALAPLRARIAALEAENQMLRAKAAEEREE
jgi:hypothetical protein